MGNFACFYELSSADFSSKSTFLKNSFGNTIRVSYSLNPDQARCFVANGKALNIWHPFITERLLMGRKESNQAKNIWYSDQFLCLFSLTQESTHQITVLCLETLW